MDAERGEDRISDVADADCKGRNDGRNAAGAHFCDQKFSDVLADFLGFGRGLGEGLVSSLSSVWTTPAILDGLMITIGDPMRSAHLKMGISWRAADPWVRRCRACRAA